LRSSAELNFEQFFTFTIRDLQATNPEDRERHSILDGRQTFPEASRV
jgi:hypothetical protein